VFKKIVPMAASGLERQTMPAIKELNELIGLVKKEYQLE
jgi:hypothetical protein